jgi:hypothetical protein
MAYRYKKAYFSEEAMHQEGKGTEVVLDFMKQNTSKMENRLLYYPTNSS